MKRYEAVLLCNAKSERELRESPTGDWYHRADLIAAGCLVYAPDGDPCKIISGLLILHNGRLCRTSDRWDEYYEFDVRDNKTHDWVDKVTASTIVQPVRLVKLEDVG